MMKIVEYILNMDWMEASGFVLGLLCVYFLIKENILTFAAGIAYVIISFFVFWQQRLYGDFILHIFFLILNIYGWYYWLRGKKEEQVPVTTISLGLSIKLIVLTALGILGFGYFLENLSNIFPGVEAAALPYWDSATSIMSVTAMWLTAKKKIENWYYWFVVDILATCIYFYKGIEFYAALYLVYIAMAIIGYLTWKKSMHKT